jgi:uroporphyrinogen decarboxylase
MSLTAKSNLLRAIAHALPDHVPWAGEGALRLVDHAGRKPPRSGTDPWGVTWAPLPASYHVSAGEPAESYPVAHPAHVAAELAGRPFPDPADPALFDGLLDGVDRAAALIAGQHGAGPLDRFSQLLGAPAAMLALLAEPGASKAAFNRIADYHAGIAAGYLAAGVEAGWLADDYAGDGGPLLSPRLWRQMILPALARVIAIYRQAGAPVFFHTCGRADAFIPDLLDAGVTVFNLQGDACDLAALKARYGRRIAFYGGVPSDLMLCGTPAQVQDAALATIRTLGRAGGLILAPDQPLAFPLANQAALDEAARQYGRYPLCGA